MHDKLKTAFTLVELLVVIAIVGILSGLIIVGMSSSVYNSRIAKAQIFSSSLRDSLLMNLVSEWKLDGTTADGSPATANDVIDSWNNLNNGTVSATPPTVRTGSNCVSNSCLQFNGSNNYVDFGNNPSLSMGTGNYTVSIWVKFDNATAPQIETLFACGAGGGSLGLDGYWLYRANGTSRLFMSFTDGLVTRVSGNLSGSGSLIANNWYNITVTFNRTSVAQAYINGEIQSGYSLDISGQQGSVDNNKNLTMGAYAVSNSRLTGKIDDARMYNAAIPASKIQEQYYSGLNKLLSRNELDKEEYEGMIKQ